MKKIIKRFYDFVFFFFFAFAYKLHCICNEKLCTQKNISYIEWNCVREAVYGVLKK